MCKEESDYIAAIENQWGKGNEPVFTNITYDHLRGRNHVTRLRLSRKMNNIL